MLRILVWCHLLEYTKGTVLFVYNTVVVDKKTNKLITVFSDRKNIPGKPDGYIYK